MDVGGYYGQDRAQRMLREKVQDKWQDAYAPIRHLDPLLVIAALALSAIGVVMIYSATFQKLQLAGEPTGLFATKQLISLAVAVVAMVVAAVVDYRYFRAYSAVIYLGSVLLLAVVLTPLGVSVNGAQRWLVFGGFQLQPSDIAKLGIIVALAALLHERQGEPELPTIGFALLLVAVPMGLVFLEPDLGTSIVFIWLTAVMLLVAGMRARTLIALTLTGVAGIVAAFRLDLIKDYQLERLTSFMNTGNEALAQTSLFHQNQSMIAIGSGQIVGKGLFQGTQTNLSYVPENHTDFIFTVIGEEFGFIGGLVLLGLFALLIWRGLRIAMMAKDLFGTLIAAGAVGLLILQVFVNIGMTIGIMPVTGIPLPFISYGGTSLLTHFVLIGLLLNVHMRRF